LLYTLFKFKTFWLKQLSPGLQNPIFNLLLIY
jgi:hypothetical protein